MQRPQRLSLHIAIHDPKKYAVRSLNMTKSEDMYTVLRRRTYMERISFSIYGGMNV